MILGKLIWKNPDSTLDLNRMWGVMNKGIYEGGTLTLSATNLGVTINPFIAKSFDGMTVVSDAAEILFLTAGTTQYLVLFAKYDIPTPTFQMQLVSETTWLTSVNKDYFVTFGKFVTPALATTSAASTLRYESADYSDKIGTSPWRSMVTAFANLPLVGNRDGDARLTTDTYSIYIWNGTTQAWAELNTTSNLTEVASRGAVDSMVERLAISTSGLIGSVLNSNGSYSSTPTHAGIGFGLVEQGTANKLGFSALHTYIHGHFLKTCSQVVNLPTKPGVGTRYDMVYLEVWQDTISTAMGLGYPNSSGGTTSLTGVLTHFNQALEANFGPDQTIEAIELVDPSTLLVTYSTFRTVQGVVSGSTSNPSVGMVTATNAYGNLYSQNSTSDIFAYTANAPGVYSTRTWAIPLLVLKRQSVEGNFLVFDGSTGARYAFDVAPRATTGKALTELLLLPAYKASENLALSSVKPSGFLTTAPIEYTTTVSLPESAVRVLNNALIVPPVTITLPLAPVVPINGRRDLVYYEFYNTYSTSTSTIPSVGGSSAGLVINEGNRLASWYARGVGANVGASTDEVDSMTALGFSPVSGDVALWSRPATDDEPTLDGLVYALPCTIIHRRNTGIWDVALNPNGSIGRPDDAALANAELICFREYVDLRRKIITGSDIGTVIESSFEDLKTGQLKTRLRQHPNSSDVLGTSVMMTTLTSAAPVAGKHVMTPVPSAANAHSVWSDADELIPISHRVPTSNVVSTSPDGVFSWNGGGDTGILTITAPAGMHLLADANNIICGPYTNQTVAVIDPLWNKSFAIQLDKAIIPYGVNTAPTAVGTIVVTVITSDSLGNPTQVTVTSNGWISATPATSSLVFTVWFVKPAKERAVAYNSNGSLFGSPTSVYSITSGGNTIHNGPIRATVRVLVTGTTFTITQADIYAVRPELASAAAALRLWGVHSMKATGAYAEPRYVELTDGALNVGFLQIDVTLTSALAANTPVDVVVMCDGDLINQWVEFRPESRQIRGFYNYSYAIDTDGSGVVPKSSSLLTLGYKGIWADRTGAVPVGSRGCSFADLTDPPQFGNRCGVPMLATQRQPNPDFYMYAVTASSYKQWFDTADAVGLNVDTMLPGSFLTIAGAALVNDSSGKILPNNSPYTPYVFAGSQNAGALASIICIGVMEVAPTTTFELVYETPTYQGITDTTALRSRLRGNVPYMGDTMVTTEGSNAPSLHTAVAASAHTMIQAYTYGTIGVGASSYRPATSIVIDSGRQNATGTVVSDAHNRARNRISMLRQMPYPSAPSTSTSVNYAPASALRHSAVATKPFVRLTTLNIPGSAVVIQHPNQSAYDDVNAVTNGSYFATSDGAAAGGIIYYWAFTLPAGSVLHDVSVSCTTAGATYDFALYVASSLIVTTPSQIGVASPIIPAVPSIVPITPYLNNTQRFLYQATSELNTFTLRLTGIALSSRSVTAIQVKYAEFDAPMYQEAFDASSTYLQPLGLEGLAASQRAMDPQSSMTLPSPQIKYVNVPDSWSGPDQAAMEAAYFTSGASDSSGDWARGVTSVSSNVTTTYYESGLFGYVPLSGTKLATTLSVTSNNPDIDLELPVRPKSVVTTISTPAADNSTFKNAVATITPYGMVSSTKELTLGVSTGVYDPNPLGTGYTNSHPVEPGGSTIDGFYPIGRPIVEPS